MHVEENNRQKLMKRMRNMPRDANNTESPEYMTHFPEMSQTKKNSYHSPDLVNIQQYENFYKKDV